MTLLDTSILIDALCGPRRRGPELRRRISAGERILVPVLVLYEWLRGPRLAEETAAQEALFPAAAAVPFGPEEAALAAALYRGVARPRGREVDFAIAATAIALGASLWTANVEDFEDLPGLSLASEA